MTKTSNNLYMENWSLTLATMHLRLQCFRIMFVREHCNKPFTVRALHTELPCAQKHTNGRPSVALPCATRSVASTIRYIAFDMSPSWNAVCMKSYLNTSMNEATARSSWSAKSPSLVAQKPELLMVSFS